MGILNFSTDNLITGVNIIDNNLYWTDGNSEPKKLEIDKFRDYSHLTNGTLPNGKPLVESDISVIRPHPFKAMEMTVADYVETDDKPNPPFESIFPRFSYRWRYQDGQYSPFAPFTQAAFRPKARVLTATGDREDDDYVPTTEEANFTEGFNTTLYNNVGKITLDRIPRGGKDVIEVDILYTESISSTVYVLETLEIPENQRGYDFIMSPDYEFGAPAYPDDYSLVPLKYELSARKVYRALRTNQLSRHFDDVPRRAIAQEITANRLIYGNYLKKFNQPNTISLTNEMVSAGIGDGLHVKGNRTYEIGVVYADAYGRQGAMMQTGSKTDSVGNVTEAIPLSSSFYQETRQQIQCTITSDPPEWSDTYKYYVKDVSQDFHSLISYNIYNDGTYAESNSEFVWLEFLSTDRNKITDETILIPRRANTTVEQSKSRHLVQDVQNEAPELIRAQLGLDGNLSGRSLGSFEHAVLNVTNVEGVASPLRYIQPSGSNVLEIKVRDERIDLNQSGVLGVLNGFIGKNRIDVTEGTTVVSKLDVDRSGSGYRTPQEVDLSTGEEESFLYLRFVSPIGDKAQTNWMRVTNLRLWPDVGSNRHRTGITYTLAENVAIEGTKGAPDSVVGVQNVDSSGNLLAAGTTATVGFHFINGFTASTSDGYPSNINRKFSTSGGGEGAWQLEFASSELSEEALERLQGKFWVKVPRGKLETARSAFDNKGELTALNQVWFETEPEVEESQLDLFWETSETFCVCTDHGYPNKLDWHNCSAEQNWSLPLGETEIVNEGVYLESTRINNKFNSVQLVKGVRVNTPQERYARESHPYGLTWSGIYNSRTGINRLNEFIYSDGITKELEPNYGSLQKLHTRDTNVLAFCENKIFKILADKDLLYNADGSGNVAASNRVLGQTTPFPGEFGISKNPESFASYGNNVYISDSRRGAILQVTPNNGQINEISDSGLDDFFRDRLHSADKIIGAWDDYSDSYVVSVQGYNANDPAIHANDRLPEESGESSNITVKYKPAVQGWPSFVSYIPEAGISLNNKFYTWKDGEMYMHNSNTTPRNNFYGLPVNESDSTILESYPSKVEVVFNDSPSSVKEFLTLSYEGTNSWDVYKIDTESEDGSLDSLWPWTKKENKYFTPIVGYEDILVVDSSGDIESDPDENGNTVMLSSQGTQAKSGIKGFYNVVGLESNSSDPIELFAINTEAFISSN